MQGKERNKTRIDDQFRDRSWDEMRKILDREMPPTHVKEKGRKRYLLLLAFLLVGFVSGVATMLYFNQPLDAELPVIEKTKAEIATVSKPEIEPERPKASLNNSIILEKPTDKNKSFSKSTNPQVELQTGKSPLVTMFLGDKANQDAMDLDLNQNDLVDQNEDIFPVKEPAPVSFQGLPLEIIGSKSITPEYVQPVKKLDLLEIPKDKKWAFGVTLGAYANTNSIFAGMNLGGKATFKLDRRFVIGGGLQYSILSGYKKSDLFSKSDELSSVVENDYDTTSSVVFTGGFEEYVQSQPSNTELPISSLHYIEMPVEMAYRFSEKFQVQLGVKTGYLVVANADEMLREANVRLDADRPVDIDLYNGLEKIDFATTIGLGFYPTKNLGFDLQYNHGMIDITKDEIWLQNKANSNRNIQLSATYFFGKQ